MSFSYTDRDMCILSFSNMISNNTYFNMLICGLKFHETAVSNSNILLIDCMYTDLGFGRGCGTHKQQIGKNKYGSLTIFYKLFPKYISFIADI